MIVEAEKPRHHAAVRRLLLQAFPSSAEADLVERLRDDGDLSIALVAVQGDRVIGHVGFSRMAAPFRALGLAPLAVDADRRRQGIAAALVAEGLRQVEAAGWDAVFVLGDPDYYGRFGFRADAAAGFASPYAGPYLMMHALSDDGRRIHAGRIDYAPAFASLA